jgi:hypothetical protein
MSRIKLTVVGILAAVALLAIGASSASAAFELSATKCEAGTHIALCYGTTEKQASGLLELIGEEEFTILNEVAGASAITFKSKVGEEEVFIECTRTEVRHGAELADGLFLQASPLTTNLVVDGFLHFSGCTLTKSAGLAKKCKVPTEENTNALTGVPLNAEEIEFKPEAPATVFIEIPFTNNGVEVCPATVAGNKAVKGFQVALLISPTEDLKEHLLETVLVSGLKFGGSENAAEFKADYEIEPLVAEFWSASAAA